MNVLCTQTHKALLVKPYLSRGLSLTSDKTPKKKNSCVETDCCGKPINEPKPIIYIERACYPCSFDSWKPKIPILVSAPPLVCAKTKHFKKTNCYAGMKLQEKTLDEIKAEAAKCQEQCGCKPICPAPPPPPPPKKPDCKYLIPIPKPDWDINGCLK